MDSQLQTRLCTIFENIAVLSPSSYRCGQKQFDTEPENLIASLTDILYSRCYTRNFVGQVSDLPIPKESEDANGMVDALRAANPSKPPRDYGWRIDQALEHGAILARKSGDARRFTPGHYLLLDHGSGFPEEDLPILVWPSRESVTIQPAYYHAFGETVNPCGEGYNLLRFYWNIAPDGAPQLLNYLALRLNRFQVPFSCKLPVHRSSYGRHDTGVLYVNRRYYAIASMVVAETHGAVHPHLSPETPLFTRRLAHGLAFAEDPRESFGKHRSRILAESLRSACEKGLESSDQKIEELTRQFRDRELDLDLPYLNPGSKDEYDFPRDR